MSLLPHHGDGGGYSSEAPGEEASENVNSDSENFDFPHHCKDCNSEIKVQLGIGGTESCPSPPIKVHSPVDPNEVAGTLDRPMKYITAEESDCDLKTYTDKTENPIITPNTTMDPEMLIRLAKPKPLAYVIRRLNNIQLIKFEYAFLRTKML